ncbi:hypothetical protein U1839_20885 [Sphingomonas sp. RT2P30]|uniref:hypothetical protein n=1 Tax=Parasphingomonas halimpatiens TaxID=3096162 RepID=UPI002FC8DFCD
MTKDIVGSFVAIPAGDKRLLAKVIFASSYFANVIALKVYPGAIASEPPDLSNTEKGGFKVFYTSGKPVKSKRWPIVGKSDVSPDERELTRRTAGGEVWVEDQYLGPASEADLASLPKMLVLGDKLVEKHASGLLQP